jgi:glycosyltransferase involved in cell wall biosynthesis
VKVTILKILIIIPAYNEEKNIPDLINKLLEYKEYNIDLLIINDCSNDGTSNVCRELGVKVIDLPCNLGIGGAVQTGYKYAHNNNYDIAIQVDGDGQHKPNYLGKLISPIINNTVDMVIGSRYLDKTGFQSTLLRRIGIRYFSRLIQLLTLQKITDPTSGFRACNSIVIALFANRYPKDFPEPESLVFLKRNQIRILEVPVVMQERKNGKSSINLIKSIYYVIKVSLAILIDRLRKQTA